MAEPVVSCPGCGKKFRVAEGAPPGQFQCTQCGRAVKYGGAGAAAAPAAGSARSGASRGGRSGGGRSSGARGGGGGGRGGGRAARGGGRAAAAAPAGRGGGRGRRYEEEGGPPPRRESNAALYTLLGLAGAAIVVLLLVLVLGGDDDPAPIVAGGGNDRSGASSTSRPPEPAPTPGFGGAATDTPAPAGGTPPAVGNQPAPSGIGGADRPTDPRSSGKDEPARPTVDAPKAANAPSGGLYGLSRAELRQKSDSEVLVELEHLSDTPSDLRSQIDRQAALLVDFSAGRAQVDASNFLVGTGRPAVPKVLSAFLKVGAPSDVAGWVNVCKVDAAMREIAGHDATSVGQLVQMMGADQRTPDRIRQTIRAWYEWWYSEGYAMEKFKEPEPEEEEDF